MQGNLLSQAKQRKLKGTPHRIGVDLLGADFDPKEILDAALKFASAHFEDVHLTLFGPAELAGNFAENISYHTVTEVVEMHDAPLKAARQKNDSSLSAGIASLKQRQIDAFISAGNTGALTAGATLELDRLPHISRPALLATLPTLKGSLSVLDAGATIKSHPKRIIELALLGAAYHSSHLKTTSPKVGLLNIGAEEKKGTPELQQAYQELQALSKANSAFEFVGNVEGRDALSGKIDILVTDGFTGNIFLKTAEGVAASLLEQIAPFLPQDKSLPKLDYTEHPGALLLGLDALIIKCHGNSSAHTITHTLEATKTQLDNQFLEHFKETLASLHHSLS